MILGMEGTLVDLAFEKPNRAALAAASRPLREETDEPLRLGRLAARVVFSQPDIDHVLTNAVADQAAAIIVHAVKPAIASVALHEYGVGLINAAGDQGTDEQKTTARIGQSMIDRAATAR